MKINNSSWLGSSKNIIKRFFFRIKLLLFSPSLIRRCNDNYNSNSTVVSHFTNRQEIFKYARQKSPFYQNHYINHSSVECEADFQNLPLLRRKDIIDSFDKIKVPGISNKYIRKLTSSGTTGSPIRILQDLRNPLAILQWRIMEGWGIKPWENQAYVYRKARPTFKKMLNTILWWPTKRAFLESSQMSDLEISRFIRKYFKIRPVLLQGYIDLVYNLALYILENQIEIPFPRAVWVTAGPLTPQKRKVISEAFKAPVYDQYGGMECFYIAAECRIQSGLHVLEDSVFIEILDQNNKPLPKGKWGKIIVTDLRNRVFPLIRYEIGDYGRFIDSSEPCSCGLHTDRLDVVKGRLTDVIHTPGGKTVYADYLGALFDDYPNTIKKYQLKQAVDYSVELSYVAMNGKSVMPVISKIIKELELASNHEIQLYTKKVEDIPELNGKVPLIINELTNNANGS